MKAKKLSDRQKNILKYIQAYVDERGYPPSIREIGDRVGISSTSVVDYNLRVLERDGYIRRDREVSRGLELVGASRGSRQTSERRLVRIPVVGRIAAGQPIEAIEDPSDVLELPAGTVSEDCYALRVRGTSMIEDHIDDGDLVIVRPQPSVDNGDIAVAIISDQTENGGATLKRFYHEGDMVRLQPRNPSMQPIMVPADQLEVRGKVVKLVRDL
ncbi:MAG: transcriptional repressor LexA [Chloroflexi bacterium]|nr:transcriptional repressor LexA [Chloroflexota bacterium]MBV9547231.1 transcriptional repressor LexA [Chloroflexota bacterium]